MVISTELLSAIFENHSAVIVGILCYLDRRFRQPFYLYFLTSLSYFSIVNVPALVLPALTETISDSTFF